MPTRAPQAAAPRALWATRSGFLLAAAGSAVGLGNLWRFPYITGEHGGGWFVAIYLACLLAIGLPVLLAEIALGRSTRASPVFALRRVAGQGSPWVSLGWLGIVGVVLALSIYAVVAGWTLHFAALALSGSTGGAPPEQAGELFGHVQRDGPRTLLWALAFIGFTVAVVQRGVQKGIERWSRIFLPLLFVLLLLLFVRGLTLDGAGEALRFVFGFHAGKLSTDAVLEAMGQAFFTLGVGVGGQLTYGSYLRSEANIVGDSLTIAGLDTAVALIGCGVIFPITFSYGLPPAEGPGLVFVTLPIAFASMPGGSALAAAFFLLLAFAALTSAINMLEIPTAHLIEARGWSRRRAALASSAGVAVVTVPAALTGVSPLLGEGLGELVGSDWFTLVIDSVTNWIMPLGGLGFALFVGWKLPEKLRREQFPAGLSSRLYRGWLAALRWLVPTAILLILLRALDVL